ncbi:MAG: hypothetical protein J6X44_09520 [Thermoguttaceae bacterium]|nr:hypothetical protein [Thermoguttaceae bacterium]
MKKAMMILLAIFSVVTQQFTSRGDEHESKTLYVNQIQQIAKNLEVFPVDLIAREGPLSNFRKGSPSPCICYRYELNIESFGTFYAFCQLGFDAEPEDIDACIDYLPQASTKEKSLILSVLYIYSYPWERQIRVTNVDEHIEATKTRSWLSIQYPTGAFNTSISEKNRLRRREASKRLQSIVSQYINDDEVAFQACIIPPDERRAFMNELEAVELIKTLKTKDGTVNDDFNEFFHILKRDNVLSVTQKKYPAENVAKAVSCYLYATYCWDLYGVIRSSDGPCAGNASEKPKTLGQIARQLLESWDPPQTIDDQE